MTEAIDATLSLGLRLLDGEKADARLATWSWGPRPLDGVEAGVVSRRLVSDVSEALAAEERVLLGHANHKDCADGVPGSHDSDVRGGVHC